MNPNIICEIGINHEGSVAKAMELIREIADAGLEYVKFQVWDEDYFDNDPNKEVFRKFYLSNKEMITLIDEAHIRGLKWGASTFGDNATNFVLHQNPDFYKVASRRAGDKALAQQLLAAGYTEKPVLVSHGMEYYNEYSRDIWHSQTVHMHCVSNYPTLPEHADLWRLSETITDSNVRIFNGYSDHTEGTSAMIVAGILGAEWIEKHVCDREQLLEWLNYKRGTPDIACSITPSMIYSASVQIAHYRRYL
ncbi:MAG: N-acetylneuraminate synthase family protein [Patescibacteria group bacterium]